MRAAGRLLSPLRVYLAGEGLVPVTRRQAVGLDGMAAAAVAAALRDARLEPAAVAALYIGNMMSGMLSWQQHLGPLVANACGLDHVEAATAEVFFGSGRSADRVADAIARPAAARAGRRCAGG